MTYKQLIDTLANIIDNHVLINQFGYGNLSDIETPETGAPNYPYAFINPVQVLIQNYGFDTTLNLILMDQPLETVDAEIDSASRMLGLIQDIIAKFKLTTLYSETDVILSVTCTPFKERFKDSVIGATATITFQINEPLDVCIDSAPAEPIYNLLVHAEATQDYYINPRTGSISPTESQVLWFNSAIQNDGGWSSYQYTAQNLGTHKFEVEFQMTLTAPDEPSESVGPAPVLLQVKNGVATFIQADTTTGWPTAYVDTTTVYTVKQTWTIDIEEPLATTYEYVRASDIPGIIELQFIEKAGSFIKIYKQD